MRRLTLSTRLSLVLVVLVVLTQAISLAGFLKVQQADNGSWRFPAPVRIAAAAEALDRTPSDRRDSLLVALNGDATRFFITDATPAGYRERGGSFPRLYQSYVAALGERDVRLLIPERGPRRRPWRAGRRTVDYAVSVALADGQRLVVAPGLAQRRRNLAVALLLANLVVGLLAALFVWRTVRRATRGLEAIARASDRFAVDLDAPPMPEVGGGEAKQVAAAFNRMQDQLKAHVADRMRMLAAVAHDLKTLLTRLRLRVALIDDEDQRNRGDRDIALMAALIEDVLLAARGEATPVCLTSVDVAGLLSELVQERCAQGQAVILARIDGGQVQTDAQALGRIVENLVENAIAYAGAAELRFEHAGDDWRLLVVDHGPGLDEAFAPFAFEPFARGEGSRSRETGGAGLGLSIARTLARRIGCDLELEVTPGGGVTAIVRPSGSGGLDDFRL